LAQRPVGDDEKRKRARWHDRDVRSLRMNEPSQRA
jgi:hypothetical protein